MSSKTNTNSTCLANAQAGERHYFLEYFLERLDNLFFCGRSSVGRAPPCQGGCRGFESLRPLHLSFGREELRNLSLNPWSANHQIHVRFVAKINCFASCSSNDREKRQNITRFQLDIKHCISLAGAQQIVAEAIAPCPKSTSLCFKFIP